MKDDIVRWRICFKGIVQGVDFRYTACHAASLLGVTGYVKNEYDGSVLCEVQGSNEQIDEFLKILRSGRFIEITEMDTKLIPLIENERSFERD